MTPLEPLYTLRVAAEMIPFPTVSSLSAFLSRHRDEFPPRYRRVKRGYVRLLSLSECTRIRAVVVKPLRKRTALPRDGKRAGSLDA